MRKPCGIFILAIALCFSSLAFAEIHGIQKNFGEQRALLVWGTPYEMGFAQGYFLGQDIMDIVY